MIRTYIKYVIMALAVCAWIGIPAAILVNFVEGWPRIATTGAVVSFILIGAAIHTGIDISCRPWLYR